jgi:SAM-dependent methyltransferase
LTATAVESRQKRIAEVGYDYDRQPKQRIAACNLCGSARFVTLVHRDRYGYRAQADGCLACGLVFLDPVMTAAAYASFYDGVYRPLVSAYHGRRIDAETIQDEQRLYAADLAALLVSHLDGQGELLDVGGSTGVVAHELSQRFGLRASILDPSPLELRQAERLGLTTIRGLIEDYEPGDRRFDLVTLCQTVDHLLDVAGSLRRLRLVLQPRGILFVDIVDFRAAYLRNGSVEEAVKIDHPFYLTEPTMEAYLGRSGFEVIRKNYAADHLHVGYVCRPAEPRPGALPASETVDELWREVRMVQNRPRNL